MAPPGGESGRAVVLITLTSHDGSLLLGARTDQVADFLDRSLAMVPGGNEDAHLDMDDLISRLLG